MPSTSVQPRAGGAVGYVPTLQRLMIVHQQLPELCSNGGIDEGASNEELSEHILYYYDADLQDNVEGASDAEHPPHASNAAIQFAGISAALRSLPNEFNERSGAAEDPTSEVYFSGATLVFAALEETESTYICAVAQLGCSNRMEEAEEGSRIQRGSPVAVRASLVKCHRLFCLLRGGIHYRLSILPKDSEAFEPQSGSSSKALFPGMGALYDLRRRRRRAHTKIARLSRSPDASHCSHLQTEIDMLDKEIHSLVEQLPIQSLREDLRSHYDDYVVNANLVAASTGLTYRCLVDDVPTPIVQPSKSIARDYAPASPDSVSSLQLGQSLDALLRSYSRDQLVGEPSLIGIHCFHDGRLAHTLPTKDIAVDDGSSCTSVTLSTSTAYTLMEYVADYRRKVFHQSKTRTFIQESTQARFQRSFRHTESGGRFEEGGAPSGTGVPEINGAFFCSPPLSMFNASEEVLDVNLPGFGSVWTPEVMLPVTTGHREGSIETVDRVRANLILYEQNRFCFLLYIVPPDHGEHDSYSKTQGLKAPQEETNLLPFAKLLQSLGCALSVILEEASLERNERLPVGGTGALQIEAGQDIVLIDRKAMSLLLISSRTREKSRTKRSGFPLLGKKVVLKRPLDMSVGLDCRHALACCLPLEALLAFDDMMQEISQLRDRSAKGDKCRKDRVYELCTYMRHGWMYAHAHEDQELYVLFNPRSFVTISDVQNAAENLREKLLGEECRIDLTNALL